MVDEFTLAKLTNATGNTAKTVSRWVDARTQRIATIPATSAKSATTTSSVVPPVVGNWQTSTANMGHSL